MWVVQQEVYKMVIWGLWHGDAPQWQQEEEMMTSKGRHQDRDRNTSL